jgi:PadR family transcriptional regulator AphA
MIQYAILGLLNWQPMTGYDLKQIFRDSLTMHWSGNNNQIYRTLVTLHEDGWVSRDVEAPEKGPARKVYSITPAGQGALEAWLHSTPELPDIKHAFLVQLAWADQLSADALDALLAQYEEEVNYRWIMQNEHAERAPHHPKRTERESLLWRSIQQNWIGMYERELKWVRQLRQDLRNLDKPKRQHKKDDGYKFMP